MTTLPMRDLAPLLRANAAGYYATEAAVGLLLEHGTWMGRRDFLEACVDYDHDGTAPVAWVIWAAVPEFLDRAPCSSSEARILRLAAELAGVDTGGPGRAPRPLEDLLSGLDDRNARLVLDAIAHVLTHGGRR